MLIADNQKLDGETETSKPEIKAKDTEAKQAKAVAETEAFIKAEKPKRSQEKTW